MYKINVDDEFRTNDLSLQPGGNVIVVIYKNKEIRYNKIKYPFRYIKKILVNIESTDMEYNPIKIYLNDILIWDCVDGWIKC